LREPASALWLHLLEVLAGALLLVGWWTPGGAILQVLINSWWAFSAAWPGPVTLVNMLVGLSLAMLGPGAWSVDARLYGRKRIEVW
jgi:putative oxidoreductase